MCVFVTFASRYWIDECQTLVILDGRGSKEPRYLYKYWDWSPIGRAWNSVSQEDEIRKYVEIMHYVDFEHASIFLGSSDMFTSMLRESKRNGEQRATQRNATQLANLRATCSRSFAPKKGGARARKSDVRSPGIEGNGRIEGDWDRERRKKRQTCVPADGVLSPAGP